MNELYHFGVKGMKWGVRNAETKARYARGSVKGRILRRAANKAESDAADLEKHGYKNEAKAVRKVAQKNRQKAKAADIKKNRIKASKKYNTWTMSTKELDARIARLSKEKKLRELTESEIKPGRTEAKRVIKNIGTWFVTGLGTAALTYVAAKKIQGKPIVPSEMGEWVGKKMLKTKK